MDRPTTEIDRLWRELLAAKADGDHDAVRAIENRMRELTSVTRFAHLTDEELTARLAALDGNRRLARTLPSIRARSITIEMDAVSSSPCETAAPATRCSSEAS